MRLLQIGIEFGKLACGLHTTKPLPPPIKYNEASVIAGIERAYPQKSVSIEPPSAPVAEVAAQSSEPPKPIWSPTDEKRDLVPYALVIGKHGFPCLKRRE